MALSSALTLPGRSFLYFLAYLGQLAALMRELTIALRSGVWRLKLVAEQIVAIGRGKLPAKVWKEAKDELWEELK